MRRLTIFLGLVLFSRLSLAPLDATPAVNRLITPRSVGQVRLGMTVAAARKALKGFSLQRTGDGEMSTLIGVLHGKRSVMTLYAGEKDSGPSINPKAVIENIEVTDPGYATKAGVHPGMALKDVERFYGKLKEIRMTEIESREFATFSRHPAGLIFRVQSDRGETAGRYPPGKSLTSQYVPSAHIYSISIRKLNKR